MPAAGRAAAATGHGRRRRCPHRRHAGRAGPDGLAYRPALRQWAEQLPQTPLPYARQRLAELAEQLRHHARVEDETLFAAMADILGQAALTGYWMQHDDIDDVLGQLLAAPDGLPDDAQELAGRLLWYCESHFEIEERHIFQESLARLAPEQWEALDRQARALAESTGAQSGPAGSNVP